MNVILFSYFFALQTHLSYGAEFSRAVEQKQVGESRLRFKISKTFIGYFVI